MIVFELTMPGVGSWNGKWSGADRRYIRTKDERKVPKELWGNSYRYRWDDGWEACVSVERMPASEARKLERKSSGFCGYDWMIHSLIKDGYIHTQEEDEDYRRLSIHNKVHSIHFCQEEDEDYRRAVEQMEYDMLYEPTYNPEDGGM